MTEEKNILLPDEYIPMTSIKSFWMMPKAIVENEELSLGAKMLYAVLGGLAGKRGTAWPSKNYLSKRLGNPSLTTLYRWQQELIDMHLLRVRQKGRGISNNYYFLRNPLIPESNPAENGQCLYAVKDHSTGKRILKNYQECMAEYVRAMEKWQEQQLIEETPFPKPHWPMRRDDYHEVKGWYVNSEEIPSVQEEIPKEGVRPDPLGEEIIEGILESMKNN